MGKPKWKILASEEVLKTKLIRFRIDKCEMPDGRIMPRYYVLEFPEWANVVPVTEDGRIVLVEQYRHAIGEWHLEIPGGSTDPSSGEDAKRAAMRELVEETGYIPEDIHLVGIHAPNPAMQNNRMHTYIGYKCRKVQEPTPDEFEDLRVRLVTVPELFDLIYKGEISHSIVLASILYALPQLGFNLPRP